MKRYIKAAVMQDVYLKDWIVHNKDCPYTITLNDVTPYTGEWEEMHDGTPYIDCPGPVFTGTYNELLSGGGDNLLFDCYGPEEYQEQLDTFYIIDKEITEIAEKPILWLTVMHE
jgi:hypothetical protein